MSFRTDGSKSSSDDCAFARGTARTNVEVRIQARDASLERMALLLPLMSAAIDPFQSLDRFRADLLHGLCVGNSHPRTYRSQMAKRRFPSKCRATVPGLNHAIWDQFRALFRPSERTNLRNSVAEFYE